MIYFRRSGKYYTEETVQMPSDIQPWQAAEWLEKNCSRCKGMYLLAMLDEMPGGCPVLVPAERRL